MKETKNRLVTIRMSENERDGLYFLMDCLGKNISDTIHTTCRFLLNIDGYDTTRDTIEHGNESKRRKYYIHTRMNDSIVSLIEGASKEKGMSVSDFIRKAIDEYVKFKK